MPRRKFTHRHSTHSDRSSRALAAEERGLEAMSDAAKRLRVPFNALAEADEAADDGPEEWHHVRRRGDPAFEMPYRRPTEWDALADGAKSVAAQARRRAASGVSLDEFREAAAFRGLRVLETGRGEPPYQWDLIFHAVDPDGVVRGSLFVNANRKTGESTWR